MIDMHCHIIPEFDDGSKNYYQTINMIKQEINLGYKGAISTSHFISDSFEYDSKEYKYHIDKLNEAIKLEGLDFIIYPGNEIYYTPNLLDLVEKNKVLTLNNSRYFLMEFPMSGMILGLEEFVENAVNKGYIPVIAHPERYSFTYSHFEILRKLKEKGAYFQGNIASIVGHYGRYPKKNIIKLLKENLIDFFGTDAHEEIKVYSKYNKAMKKIKKVISEEKLNKILYDNMNKVINDLNLE